MIEYFSKKINRKLAAICILLALLICVGCCVSGYFQYRNFMYQTYNSFAYELANIARDSIDGNKISTYLETGVKDDSYKKMADEIYKLYRNTTLYTQKSGIYVCVPDCDKLTLTNVYDVRYEEAEDKSVFEMGVVDPIGVDHPEHVVEIFKTGKKSEDYFVHKTKFGYNSSAILPVYNTGNEIVALVIADVPIPYIRETLNRYMGSIVLFTLLIVAVLMFMLVSLIRRNVTGPVEIITNEAESFVKSEINISDNLLAIKQKDEIGKLAKSIYTMENNINTYIENLTAVTAEKERIGAELDVARNIQASMLPCIFPAFPERQDFDIYATMTPAKEVGGDFYDFFMIDEKHLAIVMADVSGKGVPAALFMVIGKTLIKDHSQLGKDLGEVFTEVNNLLCEANSEGLFITAFEGVLNLETGDFDFVNAGHEMPFIYKKSEGYKPYKIKSAFVLAGMEDMKYKAGTMKIDVGDKIFQYTDGVTEATNSNNELYGMERLEKILNTACEKTPQETLKIVKEDVDKFVGEAPQFDDITMLCVEYKKRG